MEADDCELKTLTLVGLRKVVEDEWKINLERRMIQSYTLKNIQTQELKVLLSDRDVEVLEEDSLIIVEFYENTLNENVPHNTVENKINIDEHSITDALPINII